MQTVKNVTLLIVAILLSAEFAAAPVDYLWDVRIAEGAAVAAPVSNATCHFTKTNGIIGSFWAAAQANTGLYAYYDAAEWCGASSYPFEISEFSLTLGDLPGQTIWPCYFDIIVRAPNVPGDPCSGPGEELCRIPVVADKATFAYPNIGTISFPEPCCVYGPFFIGVVFTQGEINTVPELIWDTQEIPPCKGWVWYGGQYTDWSTWPPPPPPAGRGYLFFWIGGEPNSFDCGGTECFWEPGDPSKMHLPQLPNDTGWDVCATYPQMIADDWECIESGWVTDFHFWGQHKTRSGSVDSFAMTIYSDIPANPPSVPYSQPGQLLWQKTIPIADVQVTTFNTGRLEGWWNPQNGARIGNSIATYNQYDVCLDSVDWFYQDSGVVYWLGIYAYPTQTVNEWGWKSTANHWNDNAVWMVPAGPWTEIWEPDEILGADFSIAVDLNGNFVDGYAPGAYGDGWYRYPATGWWNAWFYDHPFDPRRIKAFTLTISSATPYEGGPSVIDLAINWSTNQWAIDQPPEDSFPPLPGVDEELYIERRIQYSGHPSMLTGNFSDTAWDYNPEWISIDVAGRNFYIYGSMFHECLGPLDLAFVITGRPGAEPPCDCIPGDANGDGATNVGDAVYLISYVFKGGAAPTPYPICSGDANGDCSANVGDAVYMISYVFKGGAPPVTCDYWLSSCGSPLRK